MIAGKLDAATIEKTRIEDNQRKLKAERVDQEIEWTPRYFTLNDDDKWQLNIE